MGIGASWNSDNRNRDSKFYITSRESLFSDTNTLVRLDRWVCGGKKGWWYIWWVLLVTAVFSYRNFVKNSHPVAYIFRSQRTWQYIWLIGMVIL